MPREVVEQHVGAGPNREERGRSLAGRDGQRRSDRADPCPVVGDRQRVGKAARSDQHELMGLEPDVTHADADRSGRHHTVRRYDAPFGDESRQRARIARVRPPRGRDRGHGQGDSQDKKSDPEHCRSISDLSARHSYLLVEGAPALASRGAPGWDERQGGVENGW